MRADRARGWPVRKLAEHYRLSVASVHRVVKDVRITLPNPWHCARLPRETPPPPLAVHCYLVR